MDDVRSISNETVRRVAADALSRHIGPKRRFSDEQAADEIGVETRTMQSWRLGETPPNFRNLLKLMGLLGEPFANEVLALANLRSEPIEAGDGCAFRANEKITGAAFTFARACADKRVDHVEEVELLDAAKLLIASLPGFVAAIEQRRRLAAAG